MLDGRQYTLKIYIVMRMESLSSVSYNSLMFQILDIMIENIHNGVYQPGTLLPTENQIANKYKVSRATVRRVFDRLEAMGLIYRRQGIGTFVRHASIISNPLNKFINFFDLIRDNGYQPRYSQLSAKIITPSDGIIQNLSLSKDQNVLFVKKIFFADDIPIIYCINYIPTWIFETLYTDEEALQPDFIEPDFISFFDEKCHQHIEYFISNVYADTLKGCNIPQFLPIKDPNLPVLIINEIGYNKHDQPILQSVEYHPGNLINFKLIRMR